MKQNETAKKMGSEVTIRELAKRCGSSIATISRVLNGDYNPDKASHRRIKEMISKTGYRPQKRVALSRNILCVNNQEPKEGNHIFLLSKTVEEQAPRNRFNAVISHSNDPGYLEKLVKAYNIKGIIFHSTPINTPSVPTVLVNQERVTAGYSSVNCDGFAGIVLALRHFREMGHRRVGYFCDRAEDNLFDTQSRRHFIPAAYKEAGLEFDPGLLFYCNFAPGEHWTHVEKCVDRFLAMKNPPTGIMLTGDCYAEDFYKCLRARGLDIPHDMSMIGFDDHAFALDLNPRLTNVRKPFKFMAAEALRLLDEAISGDQKPVQRIMVTPELIVRDSVRKI